MGLCIALQNESGEQIDLVADDKNLLDGLLGYPDATKFPMLSSIDRYGDTTFNRMQIGRFLEEWHSLSEKTTTPEERQLVDAVRTLGIKAQHDVHQYLVFIGD